MKSLILLLVLASAAAGPVDIQKKIFGGGPCPDNQGRHYVVLTSRDGDFDSMFCGGNLISDRWVLTAGHCDKGWFWVILGRHPTGPGISLKITPNDMTHYFDSKRCHDIMLIKLPAHNTQGLITIALPGTVTGKTVTVNCPDVPKDNPYTMIGWSFTEVGGKKKPANQLKFPDKLQCATVNVDKNCTGLNPLNNQHELCSKEPNRCNLCSGDSGGSLVGKDGVLYGVSVSSSSPKAGQSFYMDVCRYRKWIHDESGV